MGTIWLREFQGGLDTRRLAEATSGGALLRATNGHLTAGGEFEKRAAFVREYEVPSVTKGLASSASGLVVFSASDVPVPSGVRLSRMVHPNGQAQLTRILSADTFQTGMYAVGEFWSGEVYHYFRENRVTSWFDGRSRAVLRVLSGGPNARITHIYIPGKTIFRGSVKWSKDGFETAARIVEAINAQVTEPDFVASLQGDAFVIMSSVADSSYNNQPVYFETEGELAITPASGTGLMWGGLTLTGGNYQAGSFVRTIGSKMYSLAGPRLHFSGLYDPTRWTTDATGAGFIDVSAESSGADRLVAIARYQGLAAIFAEQSIQLWQLDPDPKLNKFVQLLGNTGTVCPQSVTQYGDSEVLYLDESGLRSLRARDSSNTASAVDLGVPVDDLITAQFKSLVQYERDNVIGLVEPRSGRFWLVMKDRIFVYSSFPGAGVNAWSMYETVDSMGKAFTVEAATVHRGRVYLRSGNAIYCYGGIATGEQMDATTAEAWLPYLDANNPAESKLWTGVDAALTGEWEVAAATQPTHPQTESVVAILSESSFSTASISMRDYSTHMSLRFRSRGYAQARLGSVVMHYVGGEG